jgi:hypothetical protein
MSSAPVHYGSCPACGTENTAQACYCAGCGAPLVADATHPLRPAGATQPATVPKPKAFGRWPRSARSGGSKAPTMLVLVFGLAAVVSAALPWLHVTISSTLDYYNESESGTSVGNDGWWVLGLGAGAALIQALVRIRARPVRLLQGLCELGLGAGIAFVAFRDLGDPTAAAHAVDSLAGWWGSPSAQVGVSAAAGLWYAGIAGALVGIGGLWRLLLARRQPG